MEPTSYRKAGTTVTTSHQPTSEQQDISRAFKAGKNLVINAFAGTGKTTTLRMLAEANTSTKIVYLAYNRAAKEDAIRSFPRNARCLTSHGLAYRPMIDMAKRVGGGRMTGPQLARILNITGPTRLTGDRVLAPGQLASVVRQTIKRFCYSADEQITRRHVPVNLKHLTDPDEIAALQDIVPPLAQRAWDRDITPRDGRFPMDFDYYLKAYALTHPRIDADVIMLDEAQDSNPCVAALVREQARYKTQLIMVGDQFQAIYGWRGATDAMADFGRESGVTVLSLTQSFRFGPEIAEEGNKWLTVLGSEKKLTGYDQIQSRVGTSTAPDAILCRTNAEALKRAIAALDAGKRVAFPGGAGELIALTKGAAQIKAGQPCEHMDLIGFTTWGEVQDYVEHDPEGADLKQFVDLVDSHGTDGLLAILNRICDEDKTPGRVDVTISTAHKAKGREWRIVEIAADFREPKTDPELPEGTLPVIPREMAMLAYVAVTRGQYVLDPAGLAWVDAYLPGAATAGAGDAPVDEPELTGVAAYVRYARDRATVPAGA